MGIFNLGMQSVANTLLAREGQAMTLVRQVPGTYNPTTGASSTQTTESVVGMILPYSTFIRMGFHSDGKSSIVDGDQQLLLSAIDATGAAVSIPHVNDSIIAGAVTYDIVMVAPLAGSGNTIYYDCRIRGLPA